MQYARLAGFLLPAVALAQTYTDCNPTENSTCPSDVGLNQSTYSVNFTNGESSDWVMTYGDATYDDNGLSFTITESGDAPTMQSEFYMFFGTISAIVKASSGTGIVSCVILESDDLDEIDWEWLGGDVDQVQTNYFGKGNTTSYDRGTYETVGDSQGTWHNYTIEWTSAATTWYIDGTAMRTLNYADAVDGTNYPQTPMRIKLGTWSASDSGSEGTIEWAGGETDYSDAPFTMYVQSIDITNYNPASTYTYGDLTGDWTSIVLDSPDAVIVNTTTQSSSISDSSSAGSSSGSNSSGTSSSASSTSSTATSAGVARAAPVAGLAAAMAAFAFAL
ncbi:concanavalin A-like lectin/glucanase domain-containing protein [Pestalotiopsis sp. NC0098]|nr:concanavalin A-like lectin/glucanase domain-containing protein [Pestalotiopsis sp. NC0098]